jgi:hypothetical protein
MLATAIRAFWRVLEGGGALDLDAAMSRGMGGGGRAESGR